MFTESGLKGSQSHLMLDPSRASSRGPKRDLVGGLPTSCLQILVALLLRVEKKVLKLISCYSTHFAMGCRDNVAVLKQVYCNSTHFAIR
jgi:hypothetical protein